MQRTRKKSQTHSRRLGENNSDGMWNQFEVTANGQMLHARIEIAVERKQKKLILIDGADNLLPIEKFERKFLRITKSQETDIDKCTRITN